MNAKKLFQNLTLAVGRVLPGVIFLWLSRQADANPTGMTVQSGSASAAVNGSRLTVTAGNNAFLNWQSFNIAAGQTTIFNQPSAASIVWNRINSGQNPSQIYGTLQANGVVVLLNSSGFYFGPNSFVSAAGLVVSTANCNPPQNAGGAWEFNGPPPLASIVNYGQIKIGESGSCFLIADQVENHGTIAAPGGSIGLAAGQTVSLNERADGRGVSMRVTLPQGSVDNYGTLVADAGTISLNAKVVNQNGFIQANSVRDDHGVIELVASDQLNLGADSQIVAAGDASASGSAGGSITLKSQNSFSDVTGSEIVTAGGAQGGNGGNVEISAPEVQSLNSTVDARAQAGGTAGKLLLDPDYILLSSSGTGTAGSGTVLAGDNPGTTLDLNVNTAFANLAVSQITLQAVDDITLAAGTSWNLSQTIGSSLGGVTSGNLTLQAGGNIIFGNGSSILDTHNWSVSLDAGYNFTTALIQPGVGNIYLNGGSGLSGNGSIHLTQAALNLNAGNSIVTGPGSQLVDDGGSISLRGATLDQNGLIQANSVQTVNGVIELAAGDEINLSSTSKILAQGDTLGVSSGGSVTLQSGNAFSDQAGSAVNVDGGAQGGSGGQIAISAPQMSTPVSSFKGQAHAAGYANGQLSIGADNILVNSDGSTVADTLVLNGGAQNSFFSPLASDFSQVSLNAAADLTVAAGSTIALDAGRINLNGKTVELNGTLRANSLNQANGVIEVNASDSLTLGSGSDLEAHGDNTSASPSPGGFVVLQAGNTYADTPTSVIDVAGQHRGQDGVVEIFGNGSVQSAIGNNLALLVNPYDITLSGNATDASSFNFSVYDLANYSQVDIKALDNIELNALDNAAPWSLNDSTTPASLSLQAGNAINLDDGSGITAGHNWTVRLMAGTSFQRTIAQAAPPGSDGIFLNGSAYLQTQNGNISMMAAGDIEVGTGYVNTTGGGSITVHALTGDINTGTFAQGYIFQSATSASGGYYVDPTGVGGISTMAGGDVNLTAGGDVISQLPGARATAEGATAGCGAYGTGSGQTGNVNIIAGGDVLGNYLVANGTGRISAGVLMDANGNPVESATGRYVLGSTGNAGTSSRELALNLISGGWNVTAAQDIYLQEVRNPNGVFNAVDSASGSFHAFDYAPSDYVNLTAGNLAQLGASAAALPRVDTYQVPMIYPGILDITAGAGGVVLEGDPARAAYEQLILFPSPLGSLTINTTDGGSLASGLPSSAPQLFSLIVSDSGRLQYNPPSQSAGYFGLNDHAATPVHLNSEQPVDLNISGNLDSLKLGFAEASEINVVGNMENCSFQGVNLGSADVTRINVGETAKTSMENSGILAPATDGSLVVGGDIGTQGTGGYVLGGGGTLEINAANVDLGASIGIQSKGFGLYRVNGTYPLASLFSQGANIDINLTGDLTMYSSAIASLAGAGISIHADGNVEVGAAGVAVSVLGARGIYTTGQGNLSVIADGNIDVAGSRIAAYDGGNVTVESVDGNVNAGIGGTGFVVVYSYEVDPTTHAVSVPSPTIPGSGILATTFPEDYGQAVGNILVETPRGTINASAGGIVQLPLNTGPHPRKKGQPNPPTPLPGLVEVLAGYELRDNAGNPLLAADIAAGTPDQVTAGEDINANGSGVIGGTVGLKATGSINGAIFARNNLVITAQQNINVTALAEGSISVSSGGTVSGTLIGVGGVSASGSSIDASLESNNGVSGDTSGAKGLAQGTAANATSAAASASDNTAAAAATKTDTGGEDDLLKKKKPIALARKVSRVTVILPGKN